MLMLMFLTHVWSNTPQYRLISQGGRQLLLDAALEAIKVAEDPATEGDRVLMARSFHTATVYLEVLSSFNAVSPGACVLRLPMLVRAVL